jgi:hypothetical protein
MQVDEEYYGQSLVCSMTPTEFELHCMEILCGFAEEEKLPNFKIEHNVKLKADDGTYQIDVYITHTSVGADMKILAECKQYKKSIGRDRVEVLYSRLHSLGAQKGILLSTAGFQSGAIDFAKAHGIALVQVFDTHEKWYSHSGGAREVIDEDDPIVYGEKHMPRYQAHLITAAGGLPVTIYPTRAMVNEIYKKMDELSQKMYGISFFYSSESGEERQ